MSSDHLTLAELAMEYTQSAENLACMIRSRSQKKADAVRQGDRRAAYQFEADIADLDTQRTHVLEIASLLKNYYRNKEEEETTDET